MKYLINLYKTKFLLVGYTLYKTAKGRVYFIKPIVKIIDSNSNKFYFW